MKDIDYIAMFNDLAEDYASTFEDRGEAEESPIFNYIRNYGETVYDEYAPEYDMTPEIVYEDFLSDFREVFPALKATAAWLSDKKHKHKFIQTNKFLRPSLRESLLELPSLNHVRYVLHNILDWDRNQSFDRRSLKQIAKACAKYDDNYTAKEYEEVIKKYKDDLLVRATENSSYKLKEKDSKMHETKKVFIIKNLSNNKYLAENKEENLKESISTNSFSKKFVSNIKGACRFDTKEEAREMIDKLVCYAFRENKSRISLKAPKYGILKVSEMKEAFEPFVIRNSEGKFFAENDTDDNLDMICLKDVCGRFVSDKDEAIIYKNKKQAKEAIKEIAYEALRTSLEDEDMRSMEKEIRDEIKNYEAVSLDSLKENSGYSPWGEYRSYDPKEWEPEDIELHKSIDWKARDYEDYEVEEDAFAGKVYFYGEDFHDTKRDVFHKFLRPNPIYPPYYAPIHYRKGDEKFTSVMYDGRTYGKYSIHDRKDTWELYDLLSR